MKTRDESNLKEKNKNTLVTQYNNIKTFIFWKGMAMAPLGGPQLSPCPTPTMQGHNQGLGPKPWSDGKYVHTSILTLS